VVGRGGLIKMTSQPLLPLLAKSAISITNTTERGLPVGFLAGMRRNVPKTWPVLEASPGRVWSKVCAEALPRCRGQLVLDCLGLMESAEEPPAAVYSMDEGRRSSMASGSSHTPLRRPGNKPHRFSLAIQTW